MPPTLYNKKTKRTNTLKKAIKNGFLTAPQDFEFDFIYDLSTRRVVSLKTAQKKIRQGVPEDNFITPFTDYSPATTIEDQVNEMLRANRKINPTTGIVTQSLDFKLPTDITEWNILENNPLMEELTNNIGQYIYNAIHALDNTAYDTFTFKFIVYEKVTAYTNLQKDEANEHMLEPVKYETPEKIAEYLEEPLYRLKVDPALVKIAEPAKAKKYKKYYGVDLNFYPDEFQTHTMKQLQFVRFSNPAQKIEKSFKPVINDSTGKPVLTKWGSPIMETVTAYNSNLTIEEIKYAIYNHFAEYCDTNNSVKLRIMVAGYFYIPFSTTDNPSLADYVDALRAYSPNVDRKYHAETAVSTTFNKICTYETFYFIHVVQDKSAWIKAKKKVQTELNKEPAAIKAACTEGQLATAYKALSLHYDTEIIVQYRGELYYSVFAKGEHTIISDNSRDELYKDRFVGYYHKQHIAPAIFKPLNEPVKNRNNFSLRPSKPSTQEKITAFYAFDLESYSVINDKGRKQVAFTLCVKNLYEDERLVFYGDDCINQFVEWIDSTSVKTDMSKTKAKGKIVKRLFYAHNGAKFDFLFIYKLFYAKLPSTKAIFTGAAIKTLTYYNNTFLDSYMILPAGLDNLAKSFNLPIRKLPYPYNYITSETLDNVVSVNDVPTEYWNKEEYINNLNKYPELQSARGPEILDVKDYTIKYCLSDCEILAQILVLHFAQSKGEINGRPFNTIGKMTVAQECKTVFQQAFLEDTLYPSPHNIRDCERNAYKGGRTEVFKKEYKPNNDELNYFDINSSYPASMLKAVPIKYLRAVHLDCPRTLKTYVDTNLYNVEVKFPDNVLIPNLLYRTEKKNIISLSNIPKSYHWGIELNHALELGAEIITHDIIFYEAKAIFKSYVEHFYELRKQAKKNKDEVLSQICKLRLNNLYGIFALKPYTTKVIIKTYEDFIYITKTKNVIDWNVIDDDLIILEYKDETYGENIGSLVRLSSYITSASRTNLAIFMNACGHDTIYYCDTDSVFTTATPPKALIDESVLGLWKRENNYPIIKARFLAPKTYSYTTSKYTEEKCKGIPKGLLVAGDIESITDKGLKKTLNSMFLRTLNGVTIIKQDRTIKPVYNKRIWNNNDSAPYKNIEEYNASR